MKFLNLSDFKDYLLNVLDITDKEYNISHEQYLQIGRGVLFEYSSILTDHGIDQVSFYIHVHIWKKNIYKCSYWCKFDIEEEYKKYKNDALDIEDFKFDLQHYDTLLKDIFEDNFNEFEYEKL